MKLHEAISYAIEKEGMEVIRTHRLVNYIADLQAYETHAERNIIATIIEEGYCNKLYEGLVTGSYQSAFDGVFYQLTHMIGFQEGIVKSVLDSVLTATRRTSAKPSIKNKKPLKPKPKVERKIATRRTSAKPSIKNKKPLKPKLKVERKKVEKKNENTINGHEFVDLGLSVKWATCNVGASRPEEYGDYFAWGETKPKSNYDEDNCVTYGKNLGDIAGDSRYDAARANWGGKWRMPTAAEIGELVDKKNCTWEWTTQGGHKGYRVTSKKNGNSIFLPAVGIRYETSLDHTEKRGYYWSSMSAESSTQDACFLYFNSSCHRRRWFDCFYGLTVRPVADTEAGAKAKAGAKVKAEAEARTKAYAFAKTHGNIAGHGYVDLGLSVKWATCNVGASRPEEYGSYFAWGETKEKRKYPWNNRVTYGKGFGDIAGNSYYDAATANWGSKWRMPTAAEIGELVDKKNCTWEWTTQGGHKGYRVTSKKNGNSIFLPAVGIRYETSLDHTEERGYYWSSMSAESSTQDACFLYFNSSCHRRRWFYCFYGLTVRPVAE